MTTLLFNTMTPPHRTTIRHHLQHQITIYGSRFPHLRSFNTQVTSTSVPDTHLVLDRTFALSYSCDNISRHQNSCFSHSSTRFGFSVTYHHNLTPLTTPNHLFCYGITPFLFIFSATTGRSTRKLPAPVFRIPMWCWIGHLYCDTISRH